MSLEEYKSEKSESPFSAQHPWLVIHPGDHMQKQTFFNILEDRYYVRSIPELQNKRICACAHEWLVLLDFDSGDCYLWNPTSEDKIQLPPLPEYDNLMCLLSAPPHDLECRIIFLTIETTPDDDKGVNPPTLYFCKPGYNQEFHKQQLTRDDDLSSWTVFKRKFYGLTYRRSVLVLLDLDNDSGIVTVTPIVNEPAYDHKGFLDMQHYRGYLIHQSSCDNGAQLLYVHKLYYGRLMEEVYDFLVFRFDFIKNEWLKVKSIGDTAIFLCNSWGTTCSTRGTNLKRESIYFTECDDRCVYIFNLETQSISVSRPCPHVSKTKSWFYWLNASSNAIDRFV